MVITFCTKLSKSGVITAGVVLGTGSSLMLCICIGDLLNRITMLAEE